MKTYVLKTDDDPDPILRDGQRMRTGGVVLMDAAQKVLAADTAKRTAAMHRPGSPVLEDGERQKRVARQATSDAMLSQRWKNPPALDATRPAKDAQPSPAPAADMAARYRESDMRLSQRWRSGGAA